MQRFRFALLCLMLTMSLGSSGALLAQTRVNFARQIQPLLAKRCFSCHGPDSAEGGLRLHESAAALAALDSGEHAIVPGNVEQSVLLARVAATDDGVRMPPEGEPLKPAEIELLRSWIADGAVYEQHWAFRPRQVVEPPSVTQTDWALQPLDQFILHGLEQRQLAPNPPADKRTLIRRAYYNLTGLPPTLADVEAFEQDARPEAYPELIDRLLESPQYGEHWGRHWLDLVRFAETNSFERDGAKPNAWKYRDYVIRSFNEDKPYDQFVREQLAGDELDDVTKETLTATGFYRLGIWDDEPVDPVQAQYDELDGIVSTIGQVFLGLTVNCARCHDHKIDPIPQKDYYSLLAFLADVTPYGTRGEQRAYNQLDVTPPEVTAAYAQLDADEKRLRDQMTTLEQSGIVKMSAEDQRKTEGHDRQKVLDAKLRDHLSASEWEQYTAWQAELQGLESERKKLPERESILALAKCEPTPRTTHVLLRGSPNAPGDEVQPAYLTLFNEDRPELPSPDAAQGKAGRRRVFADWVTSPDNRLTARVMANRIWQFHFGRGIVRSPNNFGQLGTPPTHPELLEYLAGRLIAHQWRLKSLHREIMLSQAYRMSSAPNAAALAVDPTNDLLWRYDLRRLGAEEVRDSILAANGRLNSESYGPSFFEQIPAEVLAGQSVPGSGWGDSSESERARRSVYIHVKRSLITPFLSAFDFPDTDTSCEARFITVQPGQALAMINGKFLQEQAGHLAARVEREVGGESHNQVARVVELVLTRRATAEDIQEGLSLLEKLRDRHRLTESEALRYYCLAALSLNEFMYLD